MNMNGVPLHVLTPDEVSERVGVPVGDLYKAGLKAYLFTNASRREAGFRALWSKWVRGMGNMPLSVETGMEFFLDTKIKNK